MNEQRFIDELRSYLGDLSPYERQEILDDYRQHYRDGHILGKSDEEIAAQLGSPRDIASEYVNLAPKKGDKSPKGKSSGLYRAAAVILFAMLTVAFMHGMYSDRYGIGSSGKNSPDFAEGVNKFANEIPEKALTGFMENFDWEPNWDNWVGAEIAETEPVEIHESYSNIKSINIGGSYNITCEINGDEDAEGVTLDINGQIPVCHDLVVTASGTKLNIKYEDNDKSVNLPHGSELKLKITMPESKLNELNVATVSGDITIDDVGAKKAIIASISGIIDIDGDFTNLTIAAISGNVKLDLPANGSSITAASVSGDIEVEFDTPPAVLNIDTTSGDIKAAIEGEYTFSYETTSGRLINNSRGVVSGEGKYSFKTTSGDIKLTRGS